MIQSKISERAVVAGVGLKSDSLTEIKESLCELEELVGAAGGEVVGSITQTLNQFNSATLMGSGKIEELKQLVEDAEATLVVVDHHLSGVQSRNLENEIGTRVLDRSQLILDIFAQRAQTYEGKLQVELAQMLDQMPRMVGAWLGSLSRQGGGGIGTRGPGETALEMDRRRINERVKKIKKKLEAVRKHRSQHRSKRKRRQIPSFALIGYTNSGKSTLLNRLTHSDVYAKDQVFATLDPTTRQIFLPDLGSEAVITDTVGFIRKLPTHLIEAFKATLEESAEADILIHVVDLSSPQMEKHMQVVDDLICDFKWEDKPIIHVFNKLDLAGVEAQFHIQQTPRVFVSATTGQGIERLRTSMSEQIQLLNRPVELYFPREEEHKIYELGREAQIAKKESSPRGTLCQTSMTNSQLSRWRDYIVQAPKSGN